MVNKIFNGIKIISLFLFIATAFVMNGRSFAAPAPAVAGGTTCYQVYLPLVVRAGNPISSDSPASVGGGTLDCSPADPNGLVDFNGDGYADLAIGIPTEDRNGLVTDNGAIQILYGTADGLNAENNQFWTQENILGVSLPDEQFGFALAIGDFDGDGTSDLAVSSPGEGRDGMTNVGQVDIIYGYPGTGLTENGTQSFGQGLNGIGGLAEEGDRFGEALISGDFNGDGFADLAVGSSKEGLESDGITEMGAVNVIYGSADGLQAADDIIFHHGLESVDLEPASGDYFGAALASEDFDGDGFDDLAVGIPGYDILGVDNVGAVMVFQGSDAGISLLGETAWRQGENSVQGNPETHDSFGTVLAAGDFDGNGVGDLVVGVPDEDVDNGVGDETDAGAVHVLFGSAIGGGLSGANDLILYQGLDGILGSPETLDRFGQALIAADFNGDGVDDLAVGVPFQDGDHLNQGYVQVLYSNGSTLSTDGQDLWAQGLVTGAPEVDDLFGYTLTAGDYDGDGFTDLVVGVPFEDVLVNAVTETDAGALQVIYGSGGGLTVVDNQIWYQESADIPDDSEMNDRFGWALGR
jgi:hypothetical protein